MSDKRKGLHPGGVAALTGGQTEPAPAEFLLYETEDGRARVECRFINDSLWLTQAMMAELFQVTVPTVNEHLKTLYTDGEIQPEATIRKFRMVRYEGGRQVSRQIDHHSLDAILAVGYRVRSTRGTQFRRWATERLSEIFAMAADYAPTLPETTRFFRFIQNKLHFAVTGKTAAELIQQRADSRQPNMGLTSWRSGRIQKSDATVAKNYLRETEIGELNRIVSMWLDFAEDQAQRRKEVFLKDWVEKLDAFLTFNEREVLAGAGPISKQQADAHAQSEYERFAVDRRGALEAEGTDFAAGLIEARPDDADGLVELEKVGRHAA